MEHYSASNSRIKMRRLLVTLAAIFLPLMAATFLSGSLRLGTLQPGQVLNAAEAHAESAHGSHVAMNMGAPDSTGTPQASCSPTGNVSISISDSSFNPSSVTVSAGTRVTWTNNGSQRHRVRDVNHSLFDSDDLYSGQSFSYTFCSGGTYNYEDSRNGFRGVIIVTGASATVTAGSTTTRTGTQGTTATPNRTGTAQPTTSPTGGTAQVNIFDDDGFSPANITVRIGTTVRWTNHHDDEHTVTSPGNFNSGDLRQGQSWQFTFNAAGTYNYFCAYHSEMQGSVTVTCDNCTPTPQVTPTVAGGNINVTIQNFAFSPQTVTILAGTTIRWTNQDSYPHTATSPGNFDSGTLNQGQSFQFTFNTPGTYNYFCAYHPGMTGSIVVVAGGSTNTPTEAATSTTQSTSTKTNTALPTQSAQPTNTAYPTNTPQPTQTTQATSTPGSQVASVTIQNFTFSPQNLTIAAGTTVRWTNQDSYPHTATSPGNFDSGTLNQGQSFEFTFNTPGTYNYFCAYHPGMTGSIVVVGASTSTATAQATVTQQTTSTRTQTAQATQTTQATSTVAGTNTPQATHTVGTTVTPQVTQTSQPTGTPGGQVVNVAIQNFAFVPQILTIVAGTTVRWTNQDSYPHTATSPGNFDSGTLNQGQSFQFTFSTPGTYNYFCAYHPGMTGSIVVTGGSSTGTATPAATGTVMGTGTRTQTAQPGGTSQATTTPASTGTAQETNTAVTTSTAQATTTPQASATPGVRVANIRNYSFEPQNLTVDVGTTVRWTNLDNDRHTVSSDSGLFNSGILNLNQSWEFTFNTAGTYSYFCEVHPGMRGSITVNAPAATATPTATMAPGQTFSDVVPGDYFYVPVNWLVGHGIISGYADGTFRPYNNATRGQVTKMVVLGEGWPLITPGTPTFSDVQPDHPFYSYIETAVQHNVISGYADETFRPYNNVTRGQLTKIIVLARAWALASPQSATFSDVPANSPFFTYIETAVQRQIISGYSDSTFRPGNNATRGQISKILYNALNAP